MTLWDIFSLKYGTKTRNIVHLYFFANQNKTIKKFSKKPSEINSCQKFVILNYTVTTYIVEYI